MNVYIAEQVAQVRSLFSGIAPSVHVRETVLRYLAALEAGYRAQDPAVGIMLRNYSPVHPTGTSGKTAAPRVTPEQLKAVMAHYFGFAHFGDIDASVTHDVEFERAVETLLSGDQDRLQAQLKEHPQLVGQSSRYGHRAGLIHYLAANGVELHRQVVPANAPDLLRLLLDHGADPEQEHRIYGGRHSLRELIESSAHPAEAGVRESLLVQLA